MFIRESELRELRNRVRTLNAVVDRLELNGRLLKVYLGLEMDEVEQKLMEAARYAEGGTAVPGTEAYKLVQKARKRRDARKPVRRGD